MMTRRKMTESRISSNIKKHNNPNEISNYDDI
jgi:hypothetical protein